MQTKSRMTGPKQPDKRRAYNENVDEPPKLVNDEAVEIEREIPAQPNESVESAEDNAPPLPPAFDEG